ncbi:MAG: HD domain-containing protein [Lachnospiraceae bacterium]|nr:HD domain-containing protein [Lachnospiraceae bacterium]
MTPETIIIIILAVLLAALVIYGLIRSRKNKDHNFEITRSLFAILLSDRPHIAASGMHVFLLTECFYDYLPFFWKLKINEDDLKYGALLRDVGKLAVPDEILNKAGKLEKKEMLLVRSHTDRTEKMLSQIEGLQNVAKWIKYHHERIDGKGYYKLKGNEIPVEARIIAITDTYSSIIMGGSYKPTGTREDALAILKMDAGTQFDEELIGYFSHIPAARLNEAGQEVERIMSRYTVE